MFDVGVYLMLVTNKIKFLSISMFDVGVYLMLVTNRF